MSNREKKKQVPEIQSSGRDMDLKSAVGDEFIEFDIEVQSIFHRLAEDIYKDTKDGIREPLANAITAVLTAEKEYGLDNPVIEVSVRDGLQPRLIIQDNGIGISEKILRDALSVIGKTTHLQEGDLLGQYGIGFLACYKLVGPNGGFFMSSRSRETDECISGIWKPGGFDMDSDGELENPFEENGSYGTRFEFDVKSSISIGEIRKWVAEFTEWSRVPVIYTEYDENWNEKYSEDYGVKTLTSTYSDQTETLVVETDEFVAYCTPEAEGRTLLLDTPIQRNHTLLGLPWEVDIRFKTENKVLVTGDYAGKITVSDTAYQKIPTELQSEYIQRKRVPKDAVSLPGPTGTRDSLKENDEFWDWLNERFLEKYRTAAQGVIRKFTDVESLLTVSETERNLVIDLLAQSDVDSTTPQKLQKSLSNKDISISSEMAEEMLRLRRKLKVVDREASSSGDIQYTHQRLWEVLQETDGNGEVFMGCQLTSKKVRAALADDANNRVVKVSSTDQYEVYEEKYGWTKLQEITWKNIDEFDVPDSIEKLFVSKKSDGSKAKSDSMTIYYGDLRCDSPIKRSPEEICNELEMGGLGPKNISKLIVFPQRAKWNVTDNKYLVNSRIGVASCTSSQLDLLKDNPSVITAGSYFSNAKTETIHTACDTYTIESVNLREDIVFHVLPYETYTLFKQPDYITKAEDYVQTQIKGFGFGSDEQKNEKFPDKQYVPITKPKLDRMRPYLKNANIITGDVSYDMGETHRLRYDVKLYVYIRISSGNKEKKYEALQNLKTSMKNGGKDIVDVVASASGDEE